MGEGERLFIDLKTDIKGDRSYQIRLNNQIIVGARSEVEDLLISQLRSEDSGEPAPTGFMVI